MQFLELVRMGSPLAGAIPPPALSWRQRRTCVLWHVYHSFWTPYLAVALSSRLHENSTVLVHRIILGKRVMDRKEQINVNSSRERSNTEITETLGMPSPMLTARSNNFRMAMENARLPRSEWLSGLNTATPSGSQEPDGTPSSLMKADVAVATAPTVTIKAEASAINQASSTKVAAATPLISLEGSGARIDSDALPGVNQSKPELIGGARENSDALPGVNQGQPELVNGLMPGKKQPFPTAITDGSASSLPTSASPGTSSSPAVTESSTVLQPSGESSIISSETSVIQTPSSSTVISSTPSTAAPSITSTPDLLPQIVTFVTVTRTEGKEYYSTESLAIPKSVNTPQMFSSSIPAPPAMETVLAVPAASDSIEPQRGLTPVSRALFILFGVLGKKYVAMYQHWF